jgi:short-subunit dehydrogenase
MELGDTDINVQVVCPGPVKSNVAANAVTEEINKVCTGMKNMCNSKRNTNLCF